MTVRTYEDKVRDRTSEDELAPVRASPLPAVKRVLVLAPHPDDEVFGCGGTLRLLADAGARITVAVASDGALGGSAADAGSETLIAAREAETRAAAAVLGYPPPSFWRLPDRGLRYGEALITRVREAVQSSAAELVFVPALSELHPDHQVLALAAAEALRQLGGQRSVAFYEVSAPLLPNTLIDITAVEERKREAMHCFGSQEAERPYAECVAALNRYRSYTLGHGARAAEAFFVTTAAELALGPAPLFESAMGRRRRIGAALDGADLALVSVIVRTRTNGSPGLQEALASVAAQTYPNLEVVVVDVDRSSAGDRAIPDFGGRYVARRLSTAGAPLSRAGAANAGLDAAGGRFLMLMDEEDVLLPEHVARLADALRGGARAAYSGVRMVAADGAELAVCDDPWEPAHLLGENFLPLPAVLFERSLLDAGCRFDEQLPALEEWDFWLQASRHTGFLHVPGVSALSRRHGAAGKAGSETISDTLRGHRNAVLAKWHDRRSPKDWEKALYWLVLRREEALALAASVRIESERLEKQQAALADEIARLQRHGEAAVRSGATLARNNADLTQNNAALARDLAGLTHNNAALAQDNAALTQNNAGLAQDNAALARSNETLTQANAQLGQEHAALVQSIGAQTRSNAVLAEQNAALTHTNAVLAGQNAGLAADVAAVRDALNAIKASTSWQLTAPLRWLVGLWRR